MRILLLIALFYTPALTQEDRPVLSIPEPARQRSTPAPGGSLTIIQVDYNDARCIGIIKGLIRPEAMVVGPLLIKPTEFLSEAASTLSRSPQPAPRHHSIP